MFSINDRTLVIADGTRISYRLEGSGPALVLTNGLTTTTTFWKYTRPIWLRRHTVLTWDLPGHGNSGPAQSPASARMQALPGMLTRVMDAVGMQRAVQVGWSTGCQVVFETYRQFPERCDQLVALFGPAERLLATTRLPVAPALIEMLVRRMPPALFQLWCRALARAFLLPGSQPLARALGLVGPHARAYDVSELCAHIGTVDPATLQIMLLSAQEHSAEAVLRSLRVPLLILAGDRDPFAPAELVGVPMHALAPGSELLRLPEATHTALLEEPELIARSVEAFLERRPRPFGAGAD
jgi:pimeloyl-ACP methyl ester carboxylesterase